MPSVVIYGSPEHSADLFHAVPAPILDPFLYLEKDGRRAATVTVLEADKVSALGVEVLDPSMLGIDELMEQGLDSVAIEAELCLRACRRLGITEATVPPDFPLFAADHLRAEGMELTIDADFFMTRRRVKNAHGARRHPARAGRRRCGDGRGRGVDPRAARRAHVPGRPRRDARRVRAGRLRAARRRDRLPRRPVGRRPRSPASGRSARASR